MNKGMSIEAALAELQKPLNGRNAKTWAFGPAVRTLIAALEQAQQRIDNPDKWTRDLEETLIAATDRNTELEARIAELDRKNCQLNSTMESWCVDRAESANRIAELEASKLSVKLPKLYGIDFCDRIEPDEKNGFLFYSEQVIEAIRVAGGSVEGSD